VQESKYAQLFVNHTSQRISKCLKIPHGISS